MTLLLAAAFCVGCNQVVGEFVKDVKRPATDDSGSDGGVDQPSISTPNSKQIKVSPGQGNLQGNRFSGVMTVTPTNKQIKGSRFAAEVSVNTTRVQ